MSGYTKLFKSIITSTIWQEDDYTRLLWITMLAMSDANGTVEGSIPGLAKMAGITIDDCKNSIKKLSSPDKYSRTQEFEGRRIKEIGGGWLILNRVKYRDKKVPRADYMRDYMKTYREKSVNKNVNNVNISKPQLAQKEKEKEKEEEKQLKQKHKDFVYLSENELIKLQMKFPDTLDGLIDDLNNYIGSKGRKYKSHYHVILAWGKKERATTKPPRRKLDEALIAREIGDL